MVTLGKRKLPDNEISTVFHNLPYGTAEFVRNLYAMIQDKQFNQIVFWDKQDKTRFCISSVQEFKDFAFKKYYPKTSYSTFIRQVSLINP